jgi:hypothetical protein
MYQIERCPISEIRDISNVALSPFRSPRERRSSNSSDTWDRRDSILLSDWLRLSLFSVNRRTLSDAIDRGGSTSASRFQPVYPMPATTRSIRISAPRPDLGTHNIVGTPHCHGFVKMVRLQGAFSWPMPVEEGTSVLGRGDMWSSIYSSAQEHGVSSN